jgi:hypothetical protein
MSTEQRSAWYGAMVDAEGHRQMQPGYAQPQIAISQTLGPVHDAIVLAAYLTGRHACPVLPARRAEREGHRIAGAHPVERHLRRTTADTHVNPSRARSSAPRMPNASSPSAMRPAGPAEQARLGREPNAPLNCSRKMGK